MRSSPRELEREVDQLSTGAGVADGLTGVRVEWRDAAPEQRPIGMTWAPGDPDADADADEDSLATLAYDVWSAQRECLEAVESGDHDIVAFLAGYGAGKSVFGARWLLAQAIVHPGSRFLAMGQTFQEARHTTYHKLFEQLPGERTTLRTSGYNGPENSPLVADYNRQDHRLTLVNDSVITLGSADKYSRFAGAEFGAIWLDEPSHYGNELHDLTGMMTTRLRGVDGPKVQLWTLTGEGYNAAWEILEKRQGPDGEPIGLDIEVIRASVLDNPYLPEGDKEMFRRNHEGTAREEQALHGGFAAATGLVYSQFSRDRHVIPHREAVDRVRDDWRVYGYDAGWNDPRVLLEIGKTSYEQLVVLDEFCKSETHVEDAIAWLDQTGKPDGTIYAEHEPAEIEKFKRAGHRVEKAEKSIDAGIAEVRKRLEPDGNVPVDEGGDGKSFMATRYYGDGGDPAERVGLLVSDRCEQTIREFLSYKEEHVGTSQAVDHCLDSIRYACMGVSEGVNERLGPGGSGTW